MLEKVDTCRLRSFLKELSKEPHIAGGPRDRLDSPVKRPVVSQSLYMRSLMCFPRELTSWIKSQWEEAGLELVSLATYDFLLSYPNSSKPNKVQKNKRHYVPLSGPPAEQ